MGGGAIVRVTRFMLTERVQRLNKVLNRPIQAYTSDAKTGRILHSNEGHFLLDSCSPGDGWTRYSLSQIVGENGGQGAQSSTFNAQEMWAYLSGIFDVLDSSYTHRFDDSSQPIPKLIQAAKDLLEAKDKTNLSLREALRTAIAGVQS